MGALYEIVKEIEKCFVTPSGVTVDSETGEVLDTEYLDNLLMEKEQKVDNIACYIKDLQAQANACKEEAQAFQTRAKSAEKKIESLKRYLTDWIAGEKIDTRRAQIRWRKSEAIRIIDEKEIPKEYKETKVIETLDKAAIKRAIKEGTAVPGAMFTDRQNVQIK